MINGRVKWFSDSKGYGFIEAQGKDYFLHFKELQMEGFKTVKEGDKVRFTEDLSPRGPSARNVYLGYGD